MRVVTVSFNYAERLRRPDYRKLLLVFEDSLRFHIPDVEIRALRVDPPDHSGAKKMAFLSNHFKLGVWVDEAHQAIADGQNLILADCDMLCTGDPSYVFSQDFDIAYTARNDHTNIPLNGGILFIKPTEAAARFLQAWADVDERMYSDWEGFHRIWRVRYAGMNQASFGYLLENAGVEGVEDTTLLDLPTATYNAVNTDWRLIDSGTVFVHIKSDLRKAVIVGVQPGEPMNSNPNERGKAALRAPAMMKWYEAATRAGVEVVRP